jgi:hypothetical protein
MNVPKSPLERIHEREMSKIEELWHGAQEELKKTSEELKLIEERQRLQDLQVLIEFMHVVISCAIRRRKRTNRRWRDSTLALTIWRIS